MAIGVIGRKCGMTRVFTEDGVSVPVTVIEVEANRVSQVKTQDSDGYNALQVTVGSRRASRVTNPWQVTLPRLVSKLVVPCVSSA